MTSYSPLAFPDLEAPEAPEKAPEAAKTWSFRVVSGLLLSAAVALLCVGKLWPSGARDADVSASQMKMGNYFYPPCPTGTFHQCPEHWDAGYHCLHGMTYHHAKSYQKYNCRHLNEGPFPLNECLNQCRIGHFGKGRWASHAWENAGDTVHVVHHYYDDGSDYMNGKGPALVDGFVDDGSDYMNGKGPAPLDGFVDDGSDYMNGKGPVPVDGFVDDGSDYMNGKGPAPVDGFVDDGSDYMNGKGPVPVDGFVDDGSDYMNGKGPAPVDGFVDDGSDYMNGKGPAPVDGFVDDGSDYMNGKGPAPVDGFVDDGSDYEKK